MRHSAALSLRGFSGVRLSVCHYSSLASACVRTSNIQSWEPHGGRRLLFVGIGMCLYGYLAAFQRYVAAESAPVGKDVANCMGENIQPGVKAAGKAVTEGIIEGLKEQQQEGLKEQQQKPQVRCLTSR